MQWKNGGGETTEIFVCPSEFGFDWRVSIAAVNRNGPFSVFAGYDRHILVLSDEGMELEITGAIKVTVAPLVPYRFSGDSTVYGRLSGGPVRDFNLIVRRDYGEGSLCVMECEAGWVLQPRGGTRLVYVLGGTGQIDGEPIEPGDSFCLCAGERATLSSSLHLVVCEVKAHLQP